MTRTTTEKIDLLWNLFVHRSDTYAEQWFDKNRGGGYNRRRNGFCSHSPKCIQECPDIEYIPLQRSHLIAHIKGDITVATYAVDTNATVKWLCLDMDIRKGEEGDVQQLTLDVAKFVSSFLPRNAWRVEFSGSRGYHLWIFFAEPIEAAKAYSIGMWIRQNVTHDPALGIEVYPKQITVRRTGNPVKIPLGIHRKTGNRCFFVRGDFTEYEDQWDVLDTVEPLFADDVDDIIERYDIKIAQAEPPPTTPSNSMVCMSRIMEEGLDEGIRDVGTFRLALYLKNTGIPYNAALTVLEHTNALSKPPLSSQELETKALSAYENSYSVFPCYDPSFDSYCSSSCRFYPKKKADRGYNDPIIIKQLSRD